MWNLIKQTCKEKNITLNQLCEKLGVSYQSLSISVKRDMRVSTLKRIADALDVSPSVLLDYNKENATATTNSPTDNTATPPQNQITCPVCRSVLTFSVVDDTPTATTENMP